MFAKCQEDACRRTRPLPPIAISFILQLRWSQLPVCFQPESLRGARITDLNSAALDDCLEYIDDEGHDAASTSHNFLERGMCALVLALRVIVRYCELLAIVTSGQRRRQLICPNIPLSVSVTGFNLLF